MSKHVSIYLGGFILLFLLVPFSLVIGVNLNEGAIITSPMHPSVYKYENGFRRPFVNSQVFHTWYNNFNDLTTVSVAELEVIPLGNPMPVKANTKLLKFPFNPKVYSVTSDEYIQHIPDEATAQVNFGVDWNKNVIELPEIYSLFYTKGPALEKKTLSEKAPESNTKVSQNLKISGDSAGGEFGYNYDYIIGKYNVEAFGEKTCLDSIKFRLLNMPKSFYFDGQTPVVKVHQGGTVVGQGVLNIVASETSKYGIDWTALVNIDKGVCVVSGGGAIPMELVASFSPKTFLQTVNAKIVEYTFRSYEDQLADVDSYLVSGKVSIDLGLYTEKASPELFITPNTDGGTFNHDTNSIIGQYQLLPSEKELCLNSLQFSLFDLTNPLPIFKEGYSDEKLMVGVYIDGADMGEVGLNYQGGGNWGVGGFLKVEKGLCFSDLENSVNIELMSSPSFGSLFSNRNDGIEKLQTTITCYAFQEKINQTNNTPPYLSNCVVSIKSGIYTLEK